MKKIASILKNKEIMNRILFTVLILFIFRIGAQITVPGVNPEGLEEYLNSGSALSLMNMLGGGTLQTFSIFALGVSPYITAQIIVQLLSTDVLPALSELRRQGQYGRKKMEYATRYLTLLLGAVQAYGIIKTIENSSEVTLNLDGNWLTYVYIIIVMLAGTMIVMWLGDQISVKGIGNGISMIIFAGIVCSLPNQFAHAFTTYVSQTAGSPENLVIAGVFKFILYVVAYLVIIAFVTFVELSQRKIPIQHSGKSGGQTQSMARASFLPIKINSAGVIPVIFASSLMMAPSVIAAFIDANSANAPWLKIFSTSDMYDMGGYEIRNDDKKSFLDEMINKIHPFTYKQGTPGYTRQFNVRSEVMSQYYGGEVAMSFNGNTAWKVYNAFTYPIFNPVSLGRNMDYADIFYSCMIGGKRHLLKRIFTTVRDCIPDYD